LGFFERIFGTSKEERFEESIMTLKDIDEFIANNINKGLEPFLKNIKTDYDNLQDSANNMLSRLKVLEKAPYSGRTDPILIRKAVGSRNSFINKMKSLVKQIQKPMGNNFDSILGFHNDLAALISITNAKTVNEYMFLKELFEKEVDEVIQSFKEINNNDKKFGNKIKEFQSSYTKLIELKKVLSEYRELSEDLKSRKKILAESENRIAELNERKNKKDEQFKSFMESGEWKSFLILQNKREVLLNEINDLKSDFAQNITRIERPLKKYQWLKKDKILEHYIENSFDSILSKDPNGKILLLALRNIKNKINEGEIELKDGEKFLVVIENMISENAIAKIFQEYSKLLVELEGIEEKISSSDISDKKYYFENELKNLNRDIEEVSVEKQEIELQIEKMEKEKKDAMKQLELLVNNVSGKRIKLQLD